MIKLNINLKWVVFPLVLLLCPLVDASCSSSSSSSSSSNTPEKGNCGKSFVIKSVPVTLTKSGKYCVKNDLTYTGSSNAITVAADNVTINFQNHSLFLTNTGARGIFASNISELTIENDKIISLSPSSNPLSAAIYLLNVSKAKIDNVYTENTFFGLGIENSTDILDINSHHKNHSAAAQAGAINILHSTAVVVRNVTTEGSSGVGNIVSYGVRILGGSKNVSIFDSNFLADSALHADEVDGLLVEHSQFTATPTTFFHIAQIGNEVPTPSSSHDIIIRNSTFTDRTPASGADGIILLSGSGVLLENVTIDIPSTSLPGFFPAALHVGCIPANSGCNPSRIFEDVIARDLIINNSNAIAVYLEGARNFVLENSLITGSSVANIRFDSATESTIRNCQITNSDGDGIVLNAGANDNAIIHNLVINNGGTGILVNTGALRNHINGNNVFDNSTGIDNNDTSTETYFNTSCNNVNNCSGVSPSQQPGDPAQAGSNICCPDPV